MKMASVLRLAGKSAVRGLPIAVGAGVSNPVAVYHWRPGRRRDRRGNDPASVLLLVK